MRVEINWRTIEPYASLLAAAGLLTLVALAFWGRSEEQSDTLRPLPANPRYFAESSGEALYFTGSHTWSNLVDIGRTYPPAPFDFEAYLDLLKRHDHNFIRLWTFEQPQFAAADGSVLYVSPQPWMRSGPGEALDGLPRFNLTRFNPDYFNRLRARVTAAAARGMYVSVMLFEGWELQLSPKPFNWRSHPFNRANNVNGVDGDVNGDGNGTEVHTLANPDVTAIQEAYVRRVVDTVGDLDNVLFEIANESGGYSTDWQYSMIDLIREHEAASGHRSHPVGMTFQWVGGENAALFESEADWISPRDTDYLDDPPVADGRKVVLLDNDHICGVCPGESFVWKSFFRGHNPIYMDPLTSDNPVHSDADAAPEYAEARAAMAETRRLAQRVDLSSIEPRPDLASTAYVLADPGERYLVYQPDDGPFDVDLRDSPGTFEGRWLDPTSGEWSPGPTANGGAWVAFEPPFERQAVLLLQRDAVADAD